MRSSAFVVSTSVVLVTLGLAACGDSGGAGGAGGSASSAKTTGAGTTSSKTVTVTTGNGPTSGTGGTAPECDEPVGTPSATLTVTNNVVTGTVKDITGAPALQQPVQLCGKDICKYGTTGGTGSLTIGDGATLDRPLFKVGDGLAFARSAYPVLTGSMAVTATVLPTPDSAKNFTAGTTVTLGNATVDFAAGTVAGFSIEYSDPAIQTLHIGQAPANKIEEIAPGKGFVDLYGFGPIETSICPAAKLTIKNDTGLAANAAVTFYLQELNIGEGFGTYGDWVKLSDGSVSADGLTIVTSAAGGLAETGLIGVKAN